jgi:hypothetical protein
MAIQTAQNATDEKMEKTFSPTFVSPLSITYAAESVQQTVAVKTNVFPKVKKYLEFRNPLILNVIRNFEFGQNESCIILTNQPLYSVKALADITEEQILEIESEIAFVVKENTTIFMENQRVIDNAVSVLKSVVDKKTGRYIEKAIAGQYPKPTYFRWLSNAFLKPTKARKMVELARMAIEFYHKRNAEEQHLKPRLSKAIEYLVLSGKRYGFDFNEKTAISLADSDGWVYQPDGDL